MKVIRLGSGMFYFMKETKPQIKKKIKEAIDQHSLLTERECSHKDLFMS